MPKPNKSVSGLSSNFYWGQHLKSSIYAHSQFIVTEVKSKQEFVFNIYFLLPVRSSTIQNKRLGHLSVKLGFVELACRSSIPEQKFSDRGPWDYYCDEGVNA